MYARQIREEAIKVAADPFPEPGAKEWIEKKMAESTAKGDNLAEQLTTVNAEIAKELAIATEPKN